MKTAIIVGAGVTGLSTAYHLAQRGYGRVIVLDKGRVGDGSSSRAAGITTGLLWTETGIRARKYATRFFREFSRQLPGYWFHNEEGCLNLYTPESWPERAALLPLYDRLEAPYQVLDAAEIRRRWPDLHPPDAFVGLHDPLGGYSEPPEYLAGLVARVKEAGVEIRENACVEGLEVRGGRIAGVRLAEGTLAADAVVAATYAWILLLLGSVEVTLPVKTFVHQRYLSAPFAPLKMPPVNADPFMGYIRPARGNRLLLGVETPQRHDWKVGSLAFRLGELEAEPGCREAAVGRFRDFFPPVTQVTWESSHVGLISFSMDGEPVLGPVRGVEGLFAGCAFHSGGFSYSPASGFFLAEWVARGATSLDLSAFSPARFDAAATADYNAASVPQSHAIRRRH